MKKIILFALIMCATTLNAQLLTERYALNHATLSSEETNETMEWLIFDNNTPEDKTDDTVRIFKYEDSVLTGFEVAFILSSEYSANSYVLKVQAKGGTWFNIRFWDNYKGDAYPMVIYEYLDGYISYTGNVKY